MYIGNDNENNSYQGHFQTRDGVLTVMKGSRAVDERLGLIVTMIVMY